MSKLSLILSYYNNPNMLTHQVETWMEYKEQDCKDLEIIITDDCSKYLMCTDFPSDFNIKAFRINEKVNWNWLACRNIGAYHAESKWLLVTDIDHIIDSISMNKLLSVLDELDENMVYQFKRTNEGKEIQPHGNTYLMTKEMYWKIGGYDERLSGLYYETTKLYKKKLQKIAKIVFLPINLIYISPTQISDACTLDLPKNMKSDGHQSKIRINEGKEKVLSFDYSQLLITSDYVC